MVGVFFFLCVCAHTPNSMLLVTIKVLKFRFIHTKYYKYKGTSQSHGVNMEQHADKVDKEDKVPAASVFNVTEGEDCFV